MINGGRKRKREREKKSRKLQWKAVKVYPSSLCHLIDAINKLKAHEFARIPPVKNASAFNG